jgi:hypothetical protein
MIKPIVGIKTVCEFKLTSGETFIKEIDVETYLSQRISITSSYLELLFGDTIIKTQETIFDGEVTILEGSCIIQKYKTWINE